MAQTDRIAGYVGDIALKLPCRVATTGAITLSGLQTIDGIAVAAGDRVLVKDQLSAVENGIYFAATGSWSRTPDFDGARDVVKGTTVSVTDGTTLSGYWFEVSSENTNQPGVDALTFAETASGPTAALAAADSAAAALVSEGAAAGSAAAALASEGTAAGSAAAALGSETNAANSAAAALGSETNAANSAAASAASAANLPNAPTAGADKYIKSNATADGWVYKTSAEVTAEVTGLTAGKAQQVDQAVSATVRAATTDFTGESLEGTLSNSGVAITAFHGVAGITYKRKCLGAGDITAGVGLTILQGGATITTAAGDTLEVYMLTATTCEVRNYQRAVDPKLAENALAGSFYGATATETAIATSPGTTNVLNSSGRPKLLTVYGYGSAGTSALYLYVEGVLHGRGQFITGNSGDQLCCLLMPGHTASIQLADDACTSLRYVLTGA